MLYEIAKEIQARLDERGYALKVRFSEDGFDRVTTTENLALIAYSEAGDEFTAPVAPGTGTKIVLRCDTGVEVLVMAVDSRKGARPHDHKRLCTHHRNAVLCELVSVVQTRKNALAHMSGAFVPPGENVTSEYGARYRIALALGIGIGRPPVDVAPAGTVTSVVTTTAIKSPELVDSSETCVASPALPEE